MEPAPNPDSSGAANVFVIDDDASVRRALARLFRSAGWNVEDFPSAQAFIDRMPPVGTGCVVLDVNMPGMTGPQLQEMMSAMALTFPVVFLTAHGDVSTGITAMKKGAVDFLLKPVDDAVLLETVSNAIARHAAARVRQREVEDILACVASLSPREREVMEHVIQGRLNKQIAGDLGLALQTVKVHRSRVMDKMKVGSVAELVRACEGAGIRPLPPAAE